MDWDVRTSPKGCMDTSRVTGGEIPGNCSGLRKTGLLLLGGEYFLIRMSLMSSW